MIGCQDTQRALRQYNKGLQLLINNSSFIDKKMPVLQSLDRQFKCFGIKKKKKIQFQGFLKASSPICSFCSPKKKQLSVREMFACRHATQIAGEISETRSQRRGGKQN